MPLDTLPVGPHVISRRQWEARPARTDMASQAPPTAAFIHYSDQEDAHLLVTGAQQSAAVRQIQRFHMDERGWSDIAYHYVVFQPKIGPLATAAPSKNKGAPISAPRGRQECGSVFAGRSVGKVPAAQLGHNTQTLALCVVAGAGDPILRRTLYLLESIIMGHPSVDLVGGHRDVVATNCPGDRLYAQIGRVAQATGRRVYPRTKG